MVNRSLYAAPLQLPSILTEATGSGWSVTYECFVFSADDLRSHTTSTIYPGNGFLFRLKLGNFIQALYVLDHSESAFLPIDSSVEFCHFLPSDLSSLSSVHSFVLSTLSHLGVPSSDPDPLSRLIFSFVQTHRHAAATALVPLCVSFFSTTILRDRSEALDWIHHGAPDSHVVGALRCTFEALTGLAVVEVDEKNDRSLEDERCMVCLEGLINVEDEEEEQLVSRLPCSHLFHSGCVSRWLKLDHRCPVCRFPLSWITAIFSNELPWLTTTHDDYAHFDNVQVEVVEADNDDDDNDNDNENDDEDEDEDADEDEDSLVDRSSSSESDSIPLVPRILNKLGLFLNNVVEYMSTSYV